MKLNVRQYNKMLQDNNISIIYSGPIWESGIDGMAEMLLPQLENDDSSVSPSKSVFSIFVEQMKNIMMYSADKEHHTDDEDKPLEMAKGTFILGVQGKAYFIQCGSVVTDKNADFLRTRIDYLNTLDKRELRQYHKQQLKVSKGDANNSTEGIGLIEIAIHSASFVDYELEPLGDGLQYFTMYTTVKMAGGKKSAKK